MTREVQGRRIAILANDGVEQAELPQDESAVALVRTVFEAGVIEGRNEKPSRSA